MFIRDSRVHTVARIMKIFFMFLAKIDRDKHKFTELNKDYDINSWQFLAKKGGFVFNFPSLWAFG